MQHTLKARGVLRGSVLISPLWQSTRIHSGPETFSKAIGSKGPSKSSSLSTVSDLRRSLAPGSVNAASGKGVTAAKMLFCTTLATWQGLELG